MMPNAKILVDAREFVDSLARDVGSARETMYCQMMTFEADAAGLGLVEMLRGCEAADRRMLVDSYVKAMISDRLLYAPGALFDRALQREARETRRLLADLPAEGIRTRYTNEVGFLLRRFARRNHKKLFLVDDRISYVGGINVSDHNYRWHDVMVRIENREITSLLREDFLKSWNGENQAGRFEFGDYVIYLLDGTTNETLFGELLDLLDAAKRSIWVETPYVTFPFFDRLGEAASRGVEVEMIAPLENNKPLFDAYTRWQARRSGIRLRYLPGEMTHTKAMLLDDHTLIVGSSNFDYLSYHVQQELFVVVRDAAVIQSFKDRVVRPDRKRSTAAAGSISTVGGRVCGWVLRAALAGSRVISVGRVESGASDLDHRSS